MATEVPFRQVQFVSPTVLYHIKRAKLNRYADDHQIYYSERNPVALEACLCEEVETGNQW